MRFDYLGAKLLLFKEQTVNRKGKFDCAVEVELFTIMLFV